MITIYDKELDRDLTINKVCEFFKMPKPAMQSSTTKESIKELCVVRLCKSIGVSRYNYKSAFFDFFACIMGEALCEKLSIKTHIASADLRFVKYEHINLVDTLKFYLDSETVEEAFLDAFHFVDSFKYLIPQLKKGAG